MSEEKPQSRSLAGARYAGIGLEFAGAMAVFCLIGWWIDKHWQFEDHRGLLICAGLGLIGGMYNLIRQALAAGREAADWDRRRADRSGDDSTSPR